MNERVLMTGVNNAPPQNLPDGVEQVVNIVANVLGDSATAMYLFGSSVVGGLRPNSDLDFLIVVEQPLSEDMRRQLVTEIMKVSGRKALAGPARPVELTVIVKSNLVPWRYPPRREFQYGEWLRADFEKGHLPQPVNDPDLAVIITKVRDHGLALLGLPAKELFEPVDIEDMRRATRESLPTLMADFHGDERNVLLTLARMWLTLSTGKVVPKNVAAEWAIAHLPTEHQEVLELARCAYLGECTDDWQRYEQQAKEVAGFMEQAIQQLLSTDNNS
jgi:aminoglycoside 9-adenylyltransferase